MNDITHRAHQIWAAECLDCVLTVPYTTPGKDKMAELKVAVVS